MPLIDIKTFKKYEEDKKARILKEIDRTLTKNLNIDESRFIINWGNFDFTTILIKGKLIGEGDDHPIVYIYSLEGKGKDIERCMMETVVKVLSESLNIDRKDITVIFNRIYSGNIFGDGTYLESGR